MARMVLVIGALLLLLYGALCAFVFLNQRAMLYFPQPASPLPAGFSTLPLPGTSVPVRVAQRTQAGPRAVVYFGGNAEDVGVTLVELASLFPTHSVYALHYRGYGGSAGEPSESALLADSLQLVDWVRERHPDLTVIGRSLGSGLAVHAASRRPVERLVLVTPYDSLGNVGAAHYPFLPVRWLMRDRYEAWRWARAVSAPTLIVQAEHDQIIPAESTDRLLAAFRPGIARRAVIASVGHNDLSSDPGYWPLVGGQQ